MKKIMSLCVLVIICFSLFSQEDKQIRYVYSSSTVEAINELESEISEDKLNFKQVWRLFQELQSQGIIILSNEQYLPIKERIEASTFSENIELKAYAQNASERYMSVSQLLNAVYNE